MQNICLKNKVCYQ